MPLTAQNYENFFLGAAAEYRFDWPRQPLHNALQQYSQLTGDSVLYDSTPLWPSI